MRHLEIKLVGILRPLRGLRMTFLSEPRHHLKENVDELIIHPLLGRAKRFGIDITCMMVDFPVLLPLYAV
jgi:hypothetical protein